MPTRQTPEKIAGERRRIWINLIVIGLVIVIGLIIVFVARAQSAAEQASEPQIVRSDSHRLQEVPNAKVTIVEFLDFECEACGAAYPFVEQLRKQYNGRVTFITRYFPIPSHTNAMNAARTAEAAARQGRFEQMYNELFRNQKTWAEKQDSQAPYLRTLAKRIGLDIAKYDRDIADPALQKRVEKDQKDGADLGVSGTPTFFLNGEKLALSSGQDFINAIDSALRK